MTTTKTFAEVAAAFRAVNFDAMGHAESVNSWDKGDHYADCASTTPWEDMLPYAAMELSGVGERDLSADEAAERYMLLASARKAFNAGWIRAEREIVAEAKAERSEALARAGAAGWRVCTFRAPGSQGHASQVAAPGCAGWVLAGLCRHGLRESAILTPAQADAVRCPDRSPAYQEDVEEILERAKAGNS